MGVGAGLASAYRTDLRALVGLSAFSSWVGYALTGILIARGSNRALPVHDLVDQWLAERMGSLDAV